MPQVLEAKDVDDPRNAGHVERVAAPAASSRLVSVDVLRAVAALIILLRHGFWAHIVQQLQERGLYGVLYPFMLGAPGVSLLLVISGFCIHARAARTDPDRAPQFGLFWKRRLRRLYPPYLAAIAISAAVAVFIIAGKLAASGQAVTAASVLDRLVPEGLGRLTLAVVAHLLFLFPLWHKAVWVFGNPVFWTLALEICLYLAYFGVPALRKRLGMDRVVLLALAVSLLWRAASTYGPIDLAGPGRSFQPVPDYPQTAWQLVIVGLTQMPARWFEWMLGALAAEAVYGVGPRRSIYRSIPLGVLAYAAAAGCQWFRLGNVFADLCWGIAAFVLLNRTIHAERERAFGPRPGIRLLAWIGSWSYSLYLIHVPILVLGHYLLLPLIPGLPGLVLCLGLAFIGCYPFYRLIEVPALRWSRAAVKPHPTSPQPGRLGLDE